LYNFGARYYDPRVGVFLTVDPLMDKYPGISSYAYAANNPIKFVDPDGMDLELNFYKGKKNESSSAELIQIINQGLDGQFEAVFSKGKNGGKNSLKLKATEGGGDMSKMSLEAQSFYNELNNMITNRNTTAVIDVFYGKKDVNIGRYDINAIDIADIKQFDDFGKGSATKQGKLIHEFAEQFSKAQLGFRKGDNKGYSKSHSKGIDAENRVNKSNRDRNDEILIGRGIYQQKYTNNNGSVTYYNIDTSRSIIRVHKTSKR